MTIVDASRGIELMFLVGSEEARVDLAFLDASRIGDTSGGPRYEVMGDVAGEGEATQIAITTRVFEGEIGGSFISKKMCWLRV